MRCVAKLTLAAASVAALLSHAQSLADRVSGAPSGVMRMSFAARANVCGDGQRFYTGGSRDNDGWRPDCGGPIRIEFERDAGEIAQLDVHVGGSWRERADVTDLGEVSAGEASSLLLDWVRTAPPEAARDAITGAALADAPDPWPRLLELGRDRMLHDSVRDHAIFWLGQSAAREATAGLAAIAAGDERTRVQRAAVFALSRRDLPGRIDQLIRIARTHANPEVVEAALFWLAESEDERALAFFEEILSR